MTFVSDMTGRLTRDKSVTVLLLVNILALLAAHYYGWNVLTLMLLYWGETAVIGLFSIVKIIHSGRLLAWVLVPFFCVHFGMFMFVHLMFLLAMFGEGTVTYYGVSIFEVAKSFFLAVFIPAAALFGSHLYSFLTNYIGKKEYLRKNPMHFFSYPYPRVIVMHITIIFGGFMTMLLNPQYALILLSILKTGADIGAHLKMHKPKPVLSS